MDLFNVGAPEVVVLILLGLLLFGPEDLVRIARKVGGLMNSLQQMWYDLSASMEMELDEAEQNEIAPRSAHRKPRARPGTPADGSPAPPEMTPEGGVEPSDGPAAEAPAGAPAEIAPEAVADSPVGSIDEEREYDDAEE